MRNTVVEDILKTGVIAHKGGNFQQAVECYTTIIRALPEHATANHNLGLISIGQKKYDEANTFLKTAVTSSPGVPQYWKSLIELLINVGDLSEASKYLNAVTQNNFIDDDFTLLRKKLSSKARKINYNGNLQDDNPNPEIVQNIVTLFNNQEPQRALEAIDKLILEYPQSFVLHNFMGIVHRKLGSTDAALQSFKRSIALKSDYFEAYTNLAALFLHSSRYSEAIDAYRVAISLDANNAVCRNNLGMAYEKTGRNEEALACYQEAANLDASYFAALFNLGNSLRMAARPDDAIISYDKAISLEPHLAEPYNNKALALKDQGRLEEAKENLEVALKINPKSADAYSNIGLVYKALGETDKARDCFQKSLKISPTATDVHLNLSQVILYAAGSQHLVDMEKIIGLGSLSLPQRSQLGFAMGKAYEDLGELKKAFECLKVGNEIRKGLLRYNPQIDERKFKRVIESHRSISKMKLCIPHELPSITPIFIVGFPRSGTTLVEQILTSSKIVYGGGELENLTRFGHKGINNNNLNEEALLQFRLSYLGDLGSKITEEKFATDKMPHNFMYLFILLKAIPEAKIVHVRRDPGATCWSNFKHYFATSNLGYSYDLDDVVSHFLSYKSLMAFWHECFRDKIIDLDYERLVTNQKEETEGLVRSLGLDWDPSFLQPHKNPRSPRTASQQQVRKRVFQGSSFSWRKFEPYIGTKFDRLYQ